MSDTRTASESSSVPDAATSLSSELVALLDERSRFEGWLAQLESRASVTPQAVLVRVRGDYAERLKKVLEQIAGRTTELRAQTNTLATRLAAVEREEHERTEQRAEAELRHMVGEFTEDQWNEIRAHSDEELKRVGTQREELNADIGRLREILGAASATTAAASASAPAVANASEDVTDVQSDDVAGTAASVASVNEEAVSAGDSPPPAVGDRGVVVEASGTDQRERPAAAELSPLVFRPADIPSSAAQHAPQPATPAGIPEKHESNAARDNEVISRTGEMARMSGSVSADVVSDAVSNAPAISPAADASPRPTPPAVEPPVPGHRASGFDDLAFVSSLVTPNTPPPRPSVPQASPAAARPSGAAPARPSEGVPAPRASDVAASRPSGAAPASRASQQIPPRVDRQSGPETPSSFLKGVHAEAVKSLRCQECGTMNYPTEWYCERCGGELAAL